MVKEPAGTNCPILRCRELHTCAFYSQADAGDFCSQSLAFRCFPLKSVRSVTVPAQEVPVRLEKVVLCNLKFKKINMKMFCFNIVTD